MTRTYRERVKHLLGSLSPDLWVLDALWSRPRLWHKELFDAVHGTRQGETVGSDCYEKDIGEGCSEVDNLARSNVKLINVFLHFVRTLPLDLIPLTRHPKQTTQERRRQRVMSHLISPILPGSVSAYVKFDKPTGTSPPSTASADLAVKARSIPRTALSKNCWLEDWHRLFALFTSPLQLHVGVLLLCAKQNSLETMSPSTPLKKTVWHLR